MPGKTTHRILHLSDPHLTASRADEDGVDAADSLDRILHDVRFVPGIDAVAFARERGIPHI
ncbi:hypothetical protein Ait01nite_079550 [Actinoplanes italicus]|uniref:Calcineurin-like phosphoesterase family protein n=1 Tax=Actinoplanes italicus TaxID=113567 RepID=A0A2T0JRA0_9ACTN|nr:hypothetical protein [Actinoplanes italicus]PRX10167.1 hypothetical protein CLV67_13452 [Actinoplanes italicus]GIE34910.1 hypothetical protein Ait01nite_079550 [Actinoplanes italicus]